LGESVKRIRESDSNSADAWAKSPMIETCVKHQKEGLRRYPPFNA
jgi:hypothetical protein